jgi:hypothetical protein
VFAVRAPIALLAACVTEFGKLRPHLPCKTCITACRTMRSGTAGMPSGPRPSVRLGYLQYNNVDFGEGAKGFHVEISSDNPTMRNGALELRLDNPAGKLVGKIVVESTGGRVNYRTLTTDVTSEARGIHNLCLVARGSAAPTEQRLFNVTSFGFTRNESLQNLAGKLGLTMGAGARTGCINASER